MINALEPVGMAAPGGHYSHAVVHGGLVYVSGQLPIGAHGPLPADSSLEVQARQVIANLELALEAAGSALERVLKCTVYVADIADWPEVNRIYAEAFGRHRPARAVVPVPALHYGYKLEIEATAALKA
ncbi:MAG: RidA family protein [Burkholderiaceae bacterium]